MSDTDEVTDLHLPGDACCADPDVFDLDAEHEAALRHDAARTAALLADAEDAALPPLTQRQEDDLSDRAFEASVLNADERDA